MQMTKEQFRNEHLYETTMFHLCSGELLQHPIQENPEWEYAGVYVDSFISGTGVAKRAERQRLIRDCEAGLIDIVLTKSISRFARNTVDLLNIVRKLKAIGVSVQFEKENIKNR